MAPRKPKPGQSLAEVNPVLAREWSPRNELSACEVSPGSTFRALWCCDKGHEWQASLNSRSSAKLGCPVCSNKRVLAGFNDVMTTHPNLAREWHSTRNQDLQPEHLMAGAGVKVWWQCSSHGHEWLASLNSRSSNKTGCPFCANQQVLQGFNDIATTHPHLADEWHPTKNKDLKPEDRMAGSGIKVWWRCSNHGHEWLASPNSRSSEGHGCPCCSNQKVLVGFNDIETTHPHLAQEWHPLKNGNLKPSEFVPGSQIKAWWLCSDESCGHSWVSIISNRSRNGHGCPKCVRKESKSEIELYESLKRTYPNAINGDRGILLNGPNGYSRELDIYLPNERVGIEFNGEYYHDESRTDKNGEGKRIKDKHEWKLDACHKRGIPLVVVWEDDWNTDPEQVVDDMLRLLMQLECDACRHAITTMGPHQLCLPDHGHSCGIIGGVPHIPHLYTYEARRCGGHRKGYFHYCDDYNRYGEDREYDTSWMGCHRQMDRGLELEDEWPVLAYEHPRRVARRSRNL